MAFDLVKLRAHSSPAFSAIAVRRSVDREKQAHRAEWYVRAISAGEG
jgi:hypothetical protein